MATWHLKSFSFSSTATDVGLKNVITLSDSEQECAHMSRCRLTKIAQTIMSFFLPRSQPAGALNFLQKKQCKGPLFHAVLGVLPRGVLSSHHHISTRSVFPSTAKLPKRHTGRRGTLSNASSETSSVAQCRSVQWRPKEHIILYPRIICIAGKPGARKGSPIQNRLRGTSFGGPHSMPVQGNPAAAANAHRS